MARCSLHVAGGQNQWYHLGSPILGYFSGDWDVHLGCSMLVQSYHPPVFVRMVLGPSAYTVYAGGDRGEAALEAKAAVPRRQFVVSS